MAPLLLLLALGTPLPQGDTSVGLLLHDSCAGPQAPVCSRLGRMFLPGFVSRDQEKALRVSRAYCELLGTSWECLDARERVLRKRPPDLAGAAGFAARACAKGSLRGCLLWAEALGCGRGIPADLPQGFSVLRRACVRDPAACAELAIWLDFPGSHAALAGSPARALAAFDAAEIALTNHRLERAEELLASLPKEGPSWPERQAFLSAMFALEHGDADQLRDAATQLHTLAPQDPVARILARIARDGLPTAWMPALVAAWTAEGKPLLHDHPWLLPSFEPQSTCLPDEGQPRVGGTLDSLGGFVTQVAHRFHGRPRLPPSEALLAAAQRYAEDTDPGVRLVAVGLLADPFLSPDQRGRAHRAASSALRQLAGEHSDEPFFLLAALVGPDPESSPVGPAALQQLEAVARMGSLRFPGALLQQTLQRHLRPEDFRDFGLSTAVEVVLQIGVERSLERVLEASGERDRRVAVVRRLGVQIAGSGWLVHLFTGARLLAAVAERTGGDADRGLAAEALARGQRLWGRWTVFPRMGRWPSAALADELRDRGFSDELGVLERYAALGAE